MLKMLLSDGLSLDDANALDDYNAERRRKARTDLEGPLEPVFYAKHPDSVTVYDDLPASGAKPRIVSLETFCEQEKFTWAGAPLIHRKRRDRVWGTPGAMLLETHMLLHWSRGFEHTAIVNLDGRADQAFTPTSKQGLDIELGKGVFYFPTQNEPLKMGTCVGAYSGMLISSAADSEFYPYGFRAAYDQDPRNTFSKYYSSGFYNAQMFGDYSRYIQHALTEAELAKIKMPEHLRILVVTANLFPYYGINTPIPTISLVALRDIGQGEQYLYNYEEYWECMRRLNKGNGSFALLDIDGDIIGLVDTEGQFTLNEHYQAEGKKPAPRCDANAEKMATARLNEMDKLNPQCQEIFLNNIRFVVNFHANRKKEDGSNFYSDKELSYIHRMQKICNCSDSEYVRTMIDNIRVELSENSELLPLSIELCVHMNYYQVERDFLKKSETKSTPKTFIEALDQETIKSIFESLLRATPGLKWSIDPQQRFCLEGNSKSLKTMKAYFEKQSVKLVNIEPFPNPPKYLLRVPAAQLVRKELKLLPPKKMILLTGQQKNYTKS